MVEPYRLNLMEELDGTNSGDESDQSVEVEMDGEMAAYIDELIKLVEMLTSIERNLSSESVINDFT